MIGDRVRRNFKIKNIRELFGEDEKPIKSCTNGCSFFDWLKKLGKPTQR